MLDLSKVPTPQKLLELVDTQEQTLKIWRLEQAMDDQFYAGVYLAMRTIYLLTMEDEATISDVQALCNGWLEEFQMRLKFHMPDPPWPPEVD